MEVFDSNFVDGIVIEATFDWYAQDFDGNVWYMGEYATQYENGQPVGHEGSWLAGKDGAKAGIIMEANPRVGDVYRQEYLVGVAEDMAKVLAVDASVSTPFGNWINNALLTRDFTPLDSGVEHKYYAPNFGLVKSMDVKGGSEVLELTGIRHPSASSVVGPLVYDEPCAVGRGDGRCRTARLASRKGARMSGVAAVPLSDQQADQILQAVASKLRVVLTSPIKTPPGTPIAASLVPATPEIDASDLVNGILNVAAVAKNVVFRDDDPLSIPSSGDLDGDQVLTVANSVAGGQPFPTPQGPILTTANLTQTNVPGLLGQLFGTFGLPDLKVQLQVRWIVRNQAGEELREEEGDLIAQNGITSPSVSLIVPPIVQELRLDTVLTPPTPDVVCLSAEVTLKLGTRSLGPVEIGPVPVIALPLLIPTVVLLFSEPNFSVVVQEKVEGLEFDDSAVVIVVPEHSPFVSAAPLFKALRKIEAVVDTLSGLGGFAGFLLGLDVDAVEGQPRFRFVAANRISDLEDIKLKPHKILGFTYGYDDFDDKVFSLLAIGLPGTRIHFYNDEDFKRSPETTQGMFTVQIDAECFVAIRTLDTSDDVEPVAIPPGRIIDFEPDQQGDGKWHTDMTSLEFDAQWLEDTANQPPGEVPRLTCAGPVRRADLGVETAVVEGRFQAVVTNAGPSAAGAVRVEVKGGSVAFSGHRSTKGTVTGRRERFVAEVGDLADGERVTITAFPKPFGADWSATAVVTSDAEDPDVENNTGTVNVIG